MGTHHDQPEQFRVVDFSTHVSGPLAGQLLSELGADVIKVENPRHGDGNRELAPRVGDESLWHVLFSGGLRSIACDRRGEEWPRLVAAAAAWADAIIVSDRAEVLVERGLDFATFAAANDRIVYCMLPAYGNHGPWRTLPAHGLNIDFSAGNGRVEDDGDGGVRVPADWRPTGSGTAAVFAALAILDGLAKREHAVAPLCVEVSLWRSSIWSQWRDYLPVANGVGDWNGFAGLGPRYGVYTTSDGRHIQIAAIEQKFWRAFCELAELPDSVTRRGEWESNRMDDGAGYPEERALIQERIARKSMREWMEAFRSAGVPAAPLLTRDEVVDSEHARTQRAFRRVRSQSGADDVLVPRLPIDRRYGAPPSPDAAVDDEPRSSAPRIGEDDDEIRALWGLR